MGLLLISNLVPRPVVEWVEPCGHTMQICKLIVIINLQSRSPDVNVLNPEIMEGLERNLDVKLNVPLVTLMKFCSQDKMKILMRRKY